MYVCVCWCGLTVNNNYAIIIWWKEPLGHFRVAGRRVCFAARVGKTKVKPLSYHLAQYRPTQLIEHFQLEQTFQSSARGL